MKQVMNVEPMAPAYENINCKGILRISSQKSLCLSMVTLATGMIALSSGALANTSCTDNVCNFPIYTAQQPIQSDVVFTSENVNITFDNIKVMDKIENITNIKSKKSFTISGSDVNNSKTSLTIQSPNLSGDHWLSAIVASSTKDEKITLKNFDTLSLQSNGVDSVLLVKNGGKIDIDDVGNIYLLGKETSSGGRGLFFRDGGGQINLKAHENIVISGYKGIYMSDGASNILNIDAGGSVSISSKAEDALHVNKNGEVNVNSHSLLIAGKRYGLRNTEENGIINVNSANIEVSGGSAALIADKGSNTTLNAETTIEINGDVISGYNKEGKLSSNNSTILINAYKNEQNEIVYGKANVVINGDLKTGNSNDNCNNSITLNLATSNSILNGSIIDSQLDVDGGTHLSMSSGASWVATGDSIVKSLDSSGANINLGESKLKIDSFLSKNGVTHISMSGQKEGQLILEESSGVGSIVVETEGTSTNQVVVKNNQTDLKLKLSKAASEKIGLNTESVSGLIDLTENRGGKRCYSHSFGR